jgi:SPP1 family predicted phage head-tail adaptor
MLPRRVSDNFAYTPRGSMNRQVQLLKPSTRRDASGEFLDPDVFATCWAKITSITPKYTEKKDQVVVEATHKIVIPYVDGITSEFTVKLISTGQIFLILEPNDPDQRQVELWLRCYQRNDGRTA